MSDPGPTVLEIEDVALRVARALERTGLPYFLAGSVASSLQGEPRATNDIDFVVRMTEEQVGPFASALGPDYSVDEEALREAVRRRGSWNIYFLPLVTKIGLFVAATSDFADSQFARRQFVSLGPQTGLYVASPEDNVLFKLRWFQKGGAASGSQWRDAVGILKVSQAELDASYLDEWAPRLGVEQLLAKARGDADAGRSGV